MAKREPPAMTHANPIERAAEKTNTTKCLEDNYGLGNTNHRFFFYIKQTERTQFQQQGNSELNYEILKGILSSPIKIVIMTAP
jgi:hypothetical protein